MLKYWSIKITKAIIAIPIATLLNYGTYLLVYEVELLEEQVMYGETVGDVADKILHTSNSTDEVKLYPLYYYYVTDGEWSEAEVYVYYLSILIDSILWYLIWKAYREGIYYQSRVYGKQFRNNRRQLKSKEFSVLKVHK